MSIGTSAAIAIGLGAAGAGASIIGASKAAGAAKTAAQIQANSGEQALDFEKQIYGDTKSNLSPYVSAGQQSLQNLMNQHWGVNGQPGDSARLSAAAQAFTPGAPNSAFSAGPYGMPVVNMNRLPPQGLPPSGPPPTGGASAPPPGGAPQPFPTNASLAQMQGAQSGAAQPQSGGSAPSGGQQMVQVQAPTGEVQMLPMDQAQLAVQKGATILG